jgi:hypothetical protein
MRKNYKGVLVMDKASLQLIGQNYASFYGHLLGVMEASDFDAESASGAMVKDLADRCFEVAQLAFEKARAKRRGRPRMESNNGGQSRGIISGTIADNRKTPRAIGRPRVTSLEWDDAVFDKVESRRVIQEIFNETNGSVDAAIKTILCEEVAPMQRMTQANTLSTHFARTKKAYYTAKKRRMPNGS